MYNYSVLLFQSNSSSLLKKALYQFSGGTVSLSETTASTLPPASIQMFLRQKRDLNAVLLSDYDKEYNSRYVRICMLTHKISREFGQKALTSNLHSYYDVRT